MALESILPDLEGASQTETTAHPLLLQQAAAAALQSCKPAPIREACCTKASLEEEKREDEQGSFGPLPRINQIMTILTLVRDTAIAALLLAAAQLLETASLVDFSPATYVRKD